MVKTKSRPLPNCTHSTATPDWLKPSTQTQNTYIALVRGFRIVEKQK